MLGSATIPKATWASIVRLASSRARRTVIVTFVKLYSSPLGEVRHPDPLHIEQGTYLRMTHNGHGIRRVNLTEYDYATFAFDFAMQVARYRVVR